MRAARERWNRTPAAAQAPSSADAVSAYLATGVLPPEAAPFTPARFSLMEASS